MLVIIDYGMGNLHSVLKAFKRLRIEAKVSADKAEIQAADKLILPGVGHFERGMENLNERGLIQTLNEEVLEKGKPILGICLGMQLFTKYSEEGNTKGLGWLDAETVQFSFPEAEKKYRIPHIGWNSLNLGNESVLYRGMHANPSFYFVHSYYVRSNNETDVAASTEYGLSFTSSMVKDNIFATQFHPEKSHDDGLKLLQNFVENA
ncbi:MAG: imidazole glycerol phosphate synthase subunit HisH [Flavobacteriales bacterium]|nr:imidazole glycerol phosphate synthase subunit HisH [Flavobacteriales bacterium]